MKIINCWWFRKLWKGNFCHVCFFLIHENRIFYQMSLKVSYLNPYFFYETSLWFYEDSVNVLRQWWRQYKKKFQKLHFNSSVATHEINRTIQGRIWFGGVAMEIRLRGSCENQERFCNVRISLYRTFKKVCGTVKLKFWNGKQSNAGNNTYI